LWWRGKKVIVKNEMRLFYNRGLAFARSRLLTAALGVESVEAEQVYAIGSIAE
jgi:hypothetical protein